MKNLLSHLKFQNIQYTYILFLYFKRLYNGTSSSDFFQCNLMCQTMRMSNSQLINFLSFVQFLIQNLKNYAKNTIHLQTIYDEQYSQSTVYLFIIFTLACLANSQASGYLVSSFSSIFFVSNTSAEIYFCVIFYSVHFHSTLAIVFMATFPFSIGLHVL